MKNFRQLIVLAMILVFNISALTAPAQAALIGTDAITAAELRKASEQKVQQALARDDVARQLNQMGVNPDEARQRVASLSDQELASLTDKLDHLPAGGDIFGTLGAIFVILLITDILGFTKVFPFTRAQR